MNQKTKILLPLLLACSIALGVWVGSYFTKRTSGPGMQSVSSGNKIDALFEIIRRSYVDTVDTKVLIEDAMPTILGELDPHSTYIKAEDMEVVTEDLEGHFSGIGVSFNMQIDTVVVINVISGGPAEKVGILPGDRIVEINDTVFVGKEVSTDKIMKRLRGPKGTDVKVGVLRSTSESMLDFTITRGDIPLNSVDASFEIVKGVGYIKVGKFGATTYNEFITALAKLGSLGCNKFMIDLRGNLGGYMEASINMVNEFLPANDLIVYTEGRMVPRNDAVSNGSGSFQTNKIVVLLDEWSASASEIFAGAIQDNDRGLIVGRRSFGKGLVQQQIPFRDGSAVRLTIARYYTPSGRCIQKKYEMGKGDDYQMDLLERYERGEFFSKDSIKQVDTVKYYTKSGRVVYGGGGIMPDIFIPRDTSQYTPYFNKLFNLSILFQFSFRYSDQNREALSKLESSEAISDYLDRQNVLSQLVSYAAQKGVPPNERDIAKSKELLKDQLYAYIARNVRGEEDFFKLFFRHDETVLRAIKEINAEN